MHFYGVKSRKISLIRKKYLENSRKFLNSSSVCHRLEIEFKLLKIKNSKTIIFVWNFSTFNKYDVVNYQLYITTHSDQFVPHTVKMRNFRHFRYFCRWKSDINATFLSILDQKWQFSFRNSQEKADTLVHGRYLLDD